MKSKKLNIMKTRPKISDAEIQSMMDFDKVLQLHKTATRAKYTWVIAGSSLVIALVVGWMIVYPRKQAPVIKDTPKDIPAVVPETKQSTVTPGQKPLQEKKKVIAKPLEVPAHKQETSTPTSAEANVYTEAEPVGGYEDLFAYFEKELKYPSDVIADTEGDVAVTFIINRNGKPEQIKFLNSLGPEFDKEVIRVIDNMPEWRPATQNGKPVPAKITQSFTFSINR